MYTITFYSFKGGVGRTMALVNVAAELVRRGRKVLVVDFDLEAPGLETYQHLCSDKPHQGIVEFVTDFRRNFEVPDVLDYLYETKPIGKKGGRMWVMPAGRRDRAYRIALANLDWPRLYKDESGFLLFEDAKLGWEQELKPDYVFIDSRTGDTDVLGICTRQLPDSVVLMFTPNEQNLAGLENVCRDIRREETEGLKKKIKLHFVAANVPDLDDERGVLRRQLKAFKSRLEFKEFSGIIRRYENLNLLDQSVFTLERPRSRLARSYRKLMRVLLKENTADREGAILFLEDYPNWMERRLDGFESVLSIVQSYHPNGTVWVGRGNSGDVSAEGKRTLKEIAGHFSDDADILAKVAECFKKEEEYVNAVGILDRALANNPNSPQILAQRATCKINLGDVDGAAADMMGFLRAEKETSESNLSELAHTNILFIVLLSHLAPSRLAEVVELFQTQGIQGVDVENVAINLCSTEEGVPHAARLLRWHFGNFDQEEIENRPHPVLASALLQARCWNEAITLLNGDLCKAEKPGPSLLLKLAFAHLGQDGKMPEAICRQALECESNFSPNIQDHEAAAWLLWGIGDTTAALAHLEIAEKQALTEKDEIHSLWRLRDCTWQEYLNDCKLLRRLIQGEPLRPAFLGPPPA
ncbi:MAG: AAA family ATPase [Planctomycetes bacterium]|nr:AAA family ATPase [Planctomycetota bacterium]